ncbi:SMP-30/gluconolactonase/LRE family protein [Lichenihabitans sp. Uapishka_5]|uniref:SMP-30/gluconolactonase/LRE family protein n=1 Tax=Lichenihabitans sp. Uapishka_5 TaxID=3037302 RepID=UPI0029E7DE37|nr:SMP-30/gluconolactonase/LRE family protein [Lichenihabitans sp. Uapishka_5]MDX7952677.1 SMP-30/gluconolactonase/LRE family protein [Lichenihabitans sp. Uapishka_5]
MVRQEPDGGLTVLADRFNGKRLNSPNDLVVARDGAIWFTDPTYGLVQPEEGRQAAPELPGRYVFRLDPGGGLAVVADGFAQPNGLAFSPDERVLYVSDTGGALNPEGTREIRAFAVDGGRLTGERLFARLPSGVPDGLKTDADGRLYAATDQGARVWAQDGTPLGLIATPATCGNLAFGGPDGRRLYLCNGSSIHSIPLKVRGAAWRA